MATVIPVDEFISDEWYPGFKPDYGHAPWCVDPVRTFRKEDEKAFWFLDFHWQRGSPRPISSPSDQDPARADEPQETGIEQPARLAAVHLGLEVGRVSLGRRLVGQDEISVRFHR